MKFEADIGAMPTRIHTSEIAQINGDIIRLCAPLTPSQNVVNKWVRKRMYREIKAFRTLTLDHLKAQVNTVLGTGYSKPWAEFVEIEVVRCGTRPLDLSNIIGGLKYTIDCLQVRWGGNKTFFLGAGLVTDDTEDHLEIINVKNRARPKWRELDHGTWLFIRRIEL